MRVSVRKRALIVRTTGDMTYLLEDLNGQDPAIRMKNVVTTLHEKGFFIPCKDSFGELHYVNANNIVEIFVGDYSVTEDRA